MSQASRAREFIEEFWNGKSQDAALFNLFSDSFLYKTVIGSRVGRKCYQAYGKDWNYAFPDYRITVDQVEKASDMVVMAMECRGTHLRSFNDSEKYSVKVVQASSFSERFGNAAPFGNVIHAKLTWVMHFSRGEVVKLVTLFDKKTPYKQLGLSSPLSSEQMYEAQQKQLCLALRECMQVRLTASEMQALALKLCGLSAKHAGEATKKSHRTIEAHLHNAFEKLGCYGNQHCIDLMLKNKTYPLWLELGKLLLLKK